MELLFESRMLQFCVCRRSMLEKIVSSKESQYIKKHLHGNNATRDLREEIAIAAGAST